MRILVFLKEMQIPSINVVLLKHEQLVQYPIATFIDANMQKPNGTSKAKNKLSSC